MSKKRETLMGIEITPIAEMHPVAAIITVVLCLGFALMILLPWGLSAFAYFSR